jgi:hypothetical protein
MLSDDSRLCQVELPSLPNESLITLLRVSASGRTTRPSEFVEYGQGFRIAKGLRDRGAEVSL